MSRMLVIAIVSTVLSACGGGDGPPPAAPKLVSPDGTEIPVTSEDGELEDGETTVEVENPDGTEKEVEVEVDD